MIQLGTVRIKGTYSRTGLSSLASGTFAAGGTLRKRRNVSGERVKHLRWFSAPGTTPFLKAPEGVTASGSDQL